MFNFLNWIVLIYEKKCLNFFKNKSIKVNIIDICDRKEDGFRGK